MYYVTTKAAVLPFALLGEHSSRADARQMAKELGGTCRTQAEYDELVALHAVEAPAEMDQATLEEVQESGDLEEVQESGDFEEVQESGDFEERLDAALQVADQEEKKESVAEADVIHESTVEHPCKLVWHIADEMTAANPAVRRKDVLAACVARGVAFYTARTQYQQWLGIQKEMAAREAAQAAK
jgi:hypothetical protein